MVWYGMGMGWDIWAAMEQLLLYYTLFRFANLPLPLRPLNQGEEQVAKAAAAQCVA